MLLKVGLDCGSVVYETHDFTLSIRWFTALPSADGGLGPSSRANPCSCRISSNCILTVSTSLDEERAVPYPPRHSLPDRRRAAHCNLAISLHSKGEILSGFGASEGWGDFKIARLKSGKPRVVFILRRAEARSESDSQFFRRGLKGSSISAIIAVGSLTTGRIPAHDLGAAAGNSTFVARSASQC